jgi:hypothetical protein
MRLRWRTRRGRDMLMMGSVEIGARILGLAMGKRMSWWMCVELKRVAMELRVEREDSVQLMLMIEWLRLEACRAR